MNKNPNSTFLKDKYNKYEYTEILLILNIK